jgi:hypothetical protein
MSHYGYARNKTTLKRLFGLEHQATLSAEVADLVDDMNYFLVNMLSGTATCMTGMTLWTLTASGSWTGASCTIAGWRTAATCGRW